MLTCPPRPGPRADPTQGEDMLFAIIRRAAAGPPAVVSIEPTEADARRLLETQRPGPRDPTDRRLGEVAAVPFDRPRPHVARYVVLDVYWPAGFAPAHLLDQPAELRYVEAAYETCEDLTSRREALLEVARRNAPRMFHNTGNHPGARWSVAVEIGPPIYCRAKSVYKLADGRGCRQATVYQPMTLVQPDSEEILEAIARHKQATGLRRQA